jgi:hypothetical protein
MKVDPEQAISSIIAYKEKQQKQSEHEDKLMFDLRKDRKEVEKKLEDSIIKASGRKKKDWDKLSKESKKNFARSVEAFKKIKRPKKRSAPQLLPGRKVSGFDSGIRVPQLCVFVNPL